MKIVKSLKTSLYAALSSSGTSVILKEFKDSKDNNLAMSDFGDFGVIVIKSGDVVEILKFSGLTQNANGTCTLTVATNGRDINPTSPYAGSAVGEDFNAGAEVIVSNDPLTLSRFANLDVAGIFTQVMTFSALPQITAGNPIAANDIARKAYVDSVVAGIATTINLIVPGIAGETIAAGQLIYFDDTANQWKLCDADTAATVENVMLGIAQGAATIGVAIPSGVLLRGLDANQIGLTAGAIYYASNTAGGISATPGTKEVTLGFSYSATQFYFNPRFDQQLTENQQDLIEKIETGIDWYAASAVGTDAYAITIIPPISAYATGMKFRFKADVVNTGAATLAVSGLAAKTIKKLNDQDLATGDIEAGQIVEVVYDGTNFQMQSQTAQAEVTSFFKKTVTAGEAIDASTTPQAVYIKASDGKVYKAQANADTEVVYGFAGFVGGGQNVAMDASVVVTFRGIVSGFSTLTIGAAYYISAATAGLITATIPSDRALQVGVATSATELLILDGDLKFKQGSLTNISRSDSGAAGNEDVAVALGFRPRLLILYANGVASGGTTRSNGRGFLTAGLINPLSGFGFSNVGEAANLTPANFSPLGSIASSVDTFITGSLGILSISSTGFSVRVTWSGSFGGGGSRVVTFSGLNYLAIG